MRGQCLLAISVVERRIGGTGSRRTLVDADSEGLSIRLKPQVGFTRKEETAIAVCKFSDCGSRNSRAFNFVVITKSYSAGKTTLLVLCIDEVLGEFLRMG
jgi:hypothetical protein